MPEIKIVKELGKYYIYAEGNLIGELKPEVIEEYKRVPGVMGGNITFRTPEGERVYGVPNKEDIPLVETELKKRGDTIIGVIEGWGRPQKMIR